MLLLLLLNFYDLLLIVENQLAIVDIHPVSKGIVELTLVLGNIFTLRRSFKGHSCKVIAKSRLLIVIGRAHSKVKQAWIQIGFDPFESLILPVEACIPARGTKLKEVVGGDTPTAIVLCKHYKSLFLVLNRSNRYVVVDRRVKTELLIIVLIHDDDFVLLLVGLCLKL